jgi:septum formation protein
MRLALDLVLASASPRRKHLLDRLGLAFTVEPSPADEIIPAGQAPADVVQTLARQKVEPVAACHPQALTLAADTVVVYDGEILGKPADAADARATLRTLSGSTHTVYTGLALMHPAGDLLATDVEATHVTFGRLTSAEIDAYVASGAPMDKAGSYGIQDDTGALFVERIEGDYYNVVGLPLRRFYLLLQTHVPDAVTL